MILEGFYVIIYTTNHHIKIRLMITMLAYYLFMFHLNQFFLLMNKNNLLLGQYIYFIKVKKNLVIIIQFHPSISVTN